MTSQVSAQPEVYESSQKGVVGNPQSGAGKSKHETLCYAYELRPFCSPNTAESLAWIFMLYLMKLQISAVKTLQALAMPFSRALLKACLVCTGALLCLLLKGVDVWIGSQSARPFCMGVCALLDSQSLALLRILSVLFSRLLLLSSGLTQSSQDSHVHLKSSDSDGWKVSLRSFWSTYVPQTWQCESLVGCWTLELYMQQNHGKMVKAAGSAWVGCLRLQKVLIRVAEIAAMCSCKLWKISAKARSEALQPLYSLRPPLQRASLMSCRDLTQRPAFLCGIQEACQSNAEQRPLTIWPSIDGLLPPTIVPLSIPLTCRLHTTMRFWHKSHWLHGRHSCPTLSDWLTHSL